MPETDGIKPLIGLPTDCRIERGLRYNSAAEKYVTAIANFAGGTPVLLPAASPDSEIRHTIKHLHGILITGAASNVHPARYGAAPVAAAKPFDEARDRLSLTMIETALAGGLPIFAICRGIQELNVALGGSLINDVHKQPGRLDHLGDVEADTDIRYGPRHEVRLSKGGMIAGLLGEDEIIVNSLHRQAIERLSDQLEVEAIAPDGVIEAVKVKQARGFALAVQWHPEHDAAHNAQSAGLFHAFGDAARRRRDQAR